MARSSLPPEIRRLSIAERILLVEEIWDSIVADQEALAVTEQEREALDRRLDAYHASPDEGIPWEEVKSRLQARQ